MDWIKDNWIFVWMGFMQFAVFMKGLRDSIDKTPLVDNNWWERAFTIIAKTAAAMAGFRPTPSAAIVSAAGPIAKAMGVPVSVEQDAEAPSVIIGAVGAVVVPAVKLK